MIGSAFPSTLPADHRQALQTAGNILIDEFSDALGTEGRRAAYQPQGLVSRPRAVP